MKTKLICASFSFLVLLFAAYVLTYTNFVVGIICFLISCAAFGHYADIVYRELRKRE